MPTRRHAAGLGLLSAVLVSLAAAGPVPADAGTAKPPSVSVAGGSVSESSSQVSFTISMTKGTGAKVTVSWATSDGTAKAGADYVAASGKVVFKGPQRKQTRQVQVTVVNDGTVEPDETFTVRLTKVKGGRAKTATGTATIRDDDVAQPASRHTLSVARAGSGSGTVTSVPAGIDCPGDCNESVATGTPVTLTATADDGSAFTGWTGACSGTGTCEVTMSADRAVTAVFTAIPDHGLVAVVAGSGSGTVTSSPAGIDCPVDCDESYPGGTAVTLTATPDGASAFTGWSGDCSGTDTCQITMSADHSVTATFAPIHTLTVSTSGTGGGSVTSTPAGISCPGDCTDTFLEGTPVSLTASPDDSSAFTGWTGDCSGTGSCQVTMDQARTVGATFAPTHPTLTVTKAGDGLGSVLATQPVASFFCGNACTSLSQPYDLGTVVTLVADAAGPDSVFMGWSGGGCSGTGPCVVTMSDARSVTATFTFFDYVTVTIGGIGSGTVTSDDGNINCPGTCSYPYTRGTQRTLTAHPAAGSYFLGWAGSCTGTGTCQVTVTSPSSANVQAVFLPIGG